MDYTKYSPHLLGDTILVNVQYKEQLSDIIITPDKRNDGVDLIKATVLSIGKKFRHKNDIEVGDIVFVPRHFGTVIDSYFPNVKIFDGEDVIAKEA